MKKAIIGVVVIILVVLGALFVRSYLRVRPMLSIISARSRIVIGQKLAVGIANTSPIIRANGNDLTEDQVGRFRAVEERVEEAIGTEYQAFEAHASYLQRVNSENGRITALDVLKGFRDIGSRYVKARQAQVAALNDARFSKEEYEWVRARVYAAAGRDLTHLSLDSILETPELTTRAKVVQEHLLDTVPAVNRKRVQPLLSKIERWRVLAFFEL